MKILHVYAYGDIVNEQSEFASDMGFVTLSYIRDQVKAGGAGVETVVVHIHSRGGDVNEGFAIYDYLRGLGYKVITKIEGLCASIATVLALAGDEREMTENSELFIHNPWADPFTMTGFTADDYEKRGKEIRKAEDKLLNFYVEMTGADSDMLSAMMAEQTSLTADQALELKFITKIIETVNNHSGAKVLAYLNTKPKPKNMKINLKSVKASLTAILAKLDGVQAATSTVVTDKGNIVIESAGETVAVGDTVTMEADGTVAPDDSYTLEDGTIYVVVSGAISEITPVATTDAEALAAAEAEVETLRAQVAAQALEIAEVNALVAQVTARVGSDYKPKPRTAAFRKPAAPAKPVDPKEAAKARITAKRNPQPAAK